MNRTLINRLLGTLLLSVAFGAHAAKPVETSYDATVVSKGSFTQDYYFVTDSNYNPNAGSVGASGLSSLFGDLELQLLDQSGTKLTSLLSQKTGGDGIVKAKFTDKSFSFNLAPSTQYILRVTGTSLKDNASFGISGAFVQSISPVPEPETYSMLLAGLGLVGAIALRRGRKS